MRVHNQHNDFSKYSKSKQTRYVILGWLGIIIMATIFVMAFVSATKTFL